MDEAPEVSAKGEDDEKSSASAPAGESPEPSRKKEDEPMLYCPVCSKRLLEMKCKLICEQCGYYMSCADYY